VPILRGLLRISAGTRGTRCSQAGVSLLDLESRECPACGHTHRRESPMTMNPERAPFRTVAATGVFLLAAVGCSPGTHFKIQGDSMWPHTFARAIAAHFLRLHGGATGLAALQVARRRRADPVAHHVAAALDDAAAQPRVSRVVTRRRTRTSR